MACAGKGEQGCACPGFKGVSNSNRSERCQRELCKHKKKYHIANPPQPAPSLGVTGASVLERFNLARVAAEASEREAREETNRGFRGGGDGGKPKGGNQKGKKAGSSSKEKTKMVAVGSVQVIICGLDGSGKPVDTKCPSGQEVQDMGLAVKTARNDGVLEFGIGWTRPQVVKWLREVVVKKGREDKPGVFDFLDARDGIPADDSKSELPFVVAGKDNRRLFCLEGDVDGKLLDEGKAPAGSHKSSGQYAVRLIVRRCIPQSACENWEASIAKVKAGEELESESEDASVKGKGKAKAKAAPRRACARAKSASSSSASESPESEHSSAEPDIHALSGDEQQASAAPPTRRSSRFAKSDKAVVVKTEPDDCRPLFLDSPPYKFTSMDNSNGDSDIEEIPAPAFHRKRTGSLSLELEEGEERRKRSRSASSHGFQDEDWFEAEAQSDDLPPLNPAMPTSSFSYDPHANSGHAPYTGAGPSSSKQATHSVPSGSRNPRFNSSTGQSSRRPSASRPLHAAPAKKEDAFEIGNVSGAAPGDLRSGGEG
ncbi:hypothetical protein R3P38DRAFT_3188968 [Favolaschia claudopus]|uniref:Uncharacterized protein n=1 Tax=Favolaschia claudopus TaxID=2862362 RepID=A0AAW0BT64_9AGAR